MQQIFRKVAKRYRITNHILSLGLDIFWRKQLVKTAPHTADQEILDLACGGGELTKELLKLKPKRIIGADISPEMLANTESGPAEFIRIPEDSLPFHDKSFDLITIAFGVRNFKHHRQSLNACYRVLRKGGKIVILEFSLPNSKLLRPFYLLHLKYITPLIGRICSGSAAPYHYLSRSIIQFSMTELCRELEQQKFKIIRTRTLFPYICTIVTAEK